MNSLFRQSWKIGRGLTVLALANVAVLFASIAGRIVDDTAVNGVSIWDKPIKFAVSFLAFAPMVLWLFSRVERTRPLRIGLGVLGWSMVVEISVIVLQAIRGTTSHFNNATVLDSRLYSVMAGGVGVFAVAGLVTGFILARKNLGAGPLSTAIKFAIPMMTIGGILGFAMTSPKSGQGDGGTTIGAHTIGGLDGPDGIPFLGWSTKHGDLRVAHFFGLHSLHVVPLLALVLIWLTKRGTIHASESRQRRVVAYGAAAWAGFVATTLVQALRGVSVTQPDLTTFVSIALLAGVPALLSVLSLRHVAVDCSPLG
jgi:hypothetical protein